MKRNAWLPFLVAGGFLLFASCDVDDTPVVGDPTEPTDPAGVQTVEWTAEQVRMISRNSGNTIPRVDFDEGVDVMPGYHQWDYWPILNLDGSIANINGYRVMIVLTAPDTVLSGKRHDIVRHRYAISSDGVNWEDKGMVFTEDEIIGSRQWAGAAYYDQGQVYFYYTATGDKGENMEGRLSSDPNPGDLSYDQRIALATAQVSGEAGTVNFENYSQHSVILEADGQIYQEATGIDETGTVFAMRDPFVYRDPETNKFYMTFTAREAGDITTYNGAVGLAEAVDNDLTNWRLLPPLVVTDINSELERPHFILYENRYYLYFSTHIEKFSPEVMDRVNSPEGMYGFVADDFLGPYEPLNGSALVAANPVEDPYATFSWHVLQDNTVLSNTNYYNIQPGLEVGDFGALGEDWDRRHFGGTLAPRLVLSVDGNEVTLTNTLPPSLP
ncbi:glycoside hydrolase family 68 protein [Pararhodonellum marinum]|uniref:glycoside hydrolase family 68 protein n=1 Tax=Pararhodonellum marinum TaxID=2755358 RepID=UPI00188F40D7|nr:glycoside hydrolase family 68 protein [Pararhodonellum marinum]